MPQQTARISIDTDRVVGDVSPYLFGGFAEHMGRCIYGGVFEPGSPLADKDGFRSDVLEALREQRYSIVRYPGGNFLSGYDWRDGVGPAEKRPRRRELAWQSIESNAFGTNEFIAFCRRLGAAPMLGVNMGTGSIQDAADLVEYCNAPAGTKYADLRVSHGVPDPHGVGYWCLGNEMDGPWQIGGLDAASYGRKAREASKVMKFQDPSIKTVLCGSSSFELPTYPEWDRVALEHAWDVVDYHSIHYYATNWDDDTGAYLALPLALEDFVDTAAATLRYVKAKLRSTRDVHLSWDEWQVWYKDRSVLGGWSEAPRLSEETYNLEDALVVAQWLNLFLRRCDVLRIACVAQMVNVISWLRTSTDGILKQPSYYPFQLAARLARGRSLDVAVTAPTYATKPYGDVPVLDVAATLDPTTGGAALFVVNRSQTEAVVADVLWHGNAPTAVREAWRVTGTDPKAHNTFETPDVVVARKVATPAIVDGQFTIKLPPLSHTVLALATAAEEG